MHVDICICTHVKNWYLSPRLINSEFCRGQKFYIWVSLFCFQGFLSSSPSRPKQRGEDLSFMLEARVKWLTALLVQHYEGFHPDLVALNRQPTGNQRRVKYWGKVNRSSERSPRLAPRWTSPKKKRKFEPSPPRDIYQWEQKWSFFQKKMMRKRKERKRKRETNR